MGGEGSPLQGARPLYPAREGRELQEHVRRAAEYAGELARAVGGLRAHVLPTFRPAPAPAAARAAEVAALALLVADHGLVRHLHEVELGLQLLRVAVDAKHESAELVRSRLQRELEELRHGAGPGPAGEAALSAGAGAPGAAPAGSPARQRLKRLAEQRERSLVRRELGELTRLYESQTASLRGQLEDARASCAKLAQETEMCLARMEEALRRQAEAQREAEAQRKAARAEAESNHALAEALKRAETRAAEAAGELEQVKMSQKFFVRPGRGGKVPQEKLDLMRTIDALRKENSELKKNRATLEEEVRKARRSGQGGVSDAVLDLVHQGRVGTDDLAERIARRKLQEAQTRAGESSMLDHIKSLHLDVAPLGPAAPARRPVRRKMSYGDSTVPSSRYATPLQG